MNKQQLEKGLRNGVLDVIAKALYDYFKTDIIEVSASEVSLPLVDAERNERFVNVKVSTPRGTRNNGTYTPYDGYAAGQDWAFIKEEKENKKRAAEENKRREEEEKERKRAAKKVVKKLNKDGLDKMIHEGIDE